MSAEFEHSLAVALDALLPQTQCGQCGYNGCRPYAEAMAAGTAAINRCPPGGEEVIADLARLLKQKPMALDAGCGVAKAPAVAVIDETWCIGCTLCIQACPVDAIAGAAKAMHTVLSSECTGCELCIPPCPVDCIQMITVVAPVTRVERTALATQYRNRYLARENRLALSKKVKPKAPENVVATHNSRKQSAVQRALARAQARIK